MTLSFRSKKIMMAAFTALLAFSYVSSTMCWHTHVIGDQVADQNAAAAHLRAALGIE